MSDERFDNQVKKKLESLRPAFEESAWRKFRAVMPVPWYVTLFRDWGGWLFGGLASMAFFTTLYFNYLQNKTNELLNEEISTIKALQNTVITDSVVVEKYLTDTVYVVKTIRQVVEVPVRGTTSSSRYVNNVPVRGNSFEEYQNDRKSSENIVGVGTIYPKIEKANEGNVVTTTEKVLPTVLKTDEKTKEIAVQSDNNGNSFREKPELTKENVELENKPPVAELVIPEAKKAEIAANEKKKFSFPYVRTRVGLNADYLGIKVPSAGPTAEFFLGYSNLSVSTGALFSSPQEVTHKLTKDFNQATGKRFEDIYKDKVQPQRRIEDITIRTSFIKIPVAFNYYVNTRSNLSFMFSAGTRLDVSVFQDIQFQSSLLADKIKEKFESRPKPQVFNGLFYGMGLQYQKGRFVGQFTPYFDFKIRQNEYLVVPRTFGLNASIKYDLGRGL